jgi:hypothetical protein
MMGFTAYRGADTIVGGTQLDVTTLLVGLAVIVFSVSLAQLVLLGVSAHQRKKRADALRKAEHDLNGDGPDYENNLL